MRARRRLRCLSLLLLLTPVAMDAQLPLDDEFQVNSYTDFDQRFPSVSETGDGGFVIVWHTDSAGIDNAIRGQRFNTDGTPAGGEFEVSNLPSIAGQTSSVAPSGSDGFVVAWSSNESNGTDTDGTSVQARRFASDGTPKGEQFQVNTETTDDQRSPAASPDGNGGFVVTWRSLGSSEGDTDAGSIQARRYDSAGDPLGEQFQVNTYTTGDQYQPTASLVGAGGFVIVWASVGSRETDADKSSIQARVYNSNGLPLGDQFQVNSYTTSIQSRPAVGTDEQRGFVVAWTSLGSSGTDTSSRSIQARRYDSTGAPFDDQFQVNSFTSGYQDRAAVSPDRNGGFVVGWYSVDAPPTDLFLSIQAQAYGGTGGAVGDQFQVNTYTESEQDYPAISPVGAGSFVVTWHSVGSTGNDTLDRSIQARRFAALNLFSDDFELGSTSTWSTVVD